MSSHIVYLAFLFSFFGSWALACGEDFAATDYQPLDLRLMTDRDHYAAGDTIRFTIKVKNLSPEPILVPDTLGSNYLISTEKPDGECVVYKCAPPPPLCDQEMVDAWILLAPGEVQEISHSRRAFLYGQEGDYLWDFTLFLYHCPEILHTRTAVIKTNQAETWLSQE